MIQKFPSPWSLKGKGYMMLYKFPESFAMKNSFLSNKQKSNFCGGLGSVMLVDYEYSTAGPYRELLYIPGKFNYNENGKKCKRNAITRIFVSTMESVDNGRENWGIPKELAEFNINKAADNSEIWSIKVDGKIIFSAKMKSFFLPFPVSTKLMPFPLIQELNDKTYFTDFSGYGIGKFSKISDMKIDKNYFPDIACVKPLTVVRVDNFKITFPVSRIIEGSLQ